MRTSFNWLKQYIDISVSPEELAQRLTMIGLEVESVEDLGKKYDKFLIGQVIDVQKHPNADKLTVCKVNIGVKELQIVCGAPNVASGQKVIVGQVAAIVPHNQHDPEGKPFTLTRAKIRGTESFGMICSAFEMGMGDDKNGIMVLDPNAPLGKPLADFLNENDVVFEIGITPNRPDALSHIGIAREISALYDKELQIPQVHVQEGKESISKSVSVEIHNLENCPRYTARLITNVKIGESPVWLQSFLKAVGIRPINNIVDVTNYVLMEIGQPIHAFDYDKLTGHAIHVRTGFEGKSFFTLDHKERKLKNETMMICDSTQPVAIAGVMGGMNSEISQSTSNVLLESAYFTPKSIRRTSKTLGLSTDASQRFERGCDPNITEWAVNRAAILIQEFCGGEIAAGTIDVYPQKIKPREVSIRLTKTNEVLGTTLDSEKVCSLLRKINIIRKENNHGHPHGLLFEVPTFRPDIEREIDLIEEVARLFGYDNIQISRRSSIQLPDRNTPALLSDVLRNVLIGNGYFEVVSNSMQPKSLSELTSNDLVEVANPLSQDMATLRTSLVPSALQIIKHNIYHGTPNIRIFELGKVYFKAPKHSEHQWVKGYSEEEHLIIAASGAATLPSWSDGTPRKIDSYDLKGMIEIIGEKISLDKFKFIPYTTSNALTDFGLTIEIYGINRGFLGMVKKDILKQFDVEQDVVVTEINLERMLSDIQGAKKFHPLPEYPSVLRDIALITDNSLPVGDILQGLNEAGGSLLKNIEIFDIYRGNQIPAGKKSSAFALEFQSLEKTLAQEEIDELMDKIIRHVSLKFNASLRM
ncbi:MAG: phenylalanine--tRNA ligase subunit beta [Bacteroidota bacterium]